MSLPEEAGSARELAIACTWQWPGRGRLRPRGEPAWPIVRSAVAVAAAPPLLLECGQARGPLERWTGSQADWRGRDLERQPDRVLPDLRLPVLRPLRPGASGGRGGTGERRRRHPGERRSRDPAERRRSPCRAGPPAGFRYPPRGACPFPGKRPGYMEQRTGEDGLRPVPLSGGWTRRTPSRKWRLLLRREAEWSEQSGVTRIIGAEKKIEASLPLDPPLRLTATIDRLEEGEDRVVIVDYKSGESDLPVRPGERRTRPASAVRVCRTRRDPGREGHRPLRLARSPGQGVGYRLLARGGCMAAGPCRGGRPGGSRGRRLGRFQSQPPGALSDLVLLPPRLPGERVQPMGNGTDTGAGPHRGRAGL